MNDHPRNGGRNSLGNWPLTAAVFLTATSAGFLLIFGVILPAPTKGSAWQAALLGLLVGGIFTAAMLSRRGGRSTIVPALISLACALLLTGGAGFGYLATCNYEGHNDSSNGFFLLLAVVGALLVVGTAIWLFVAIIVRLFRKPPEQETK